MKEQQILCPVCGEGHLVEHTHARDAELEGYSYVVKGLRHSLCDHCGEDITTPDQSRYNKRAIIEARNRAVAERDRAQRLSPTDILRIRKTLGLTQVQAARVFGGGPNAFGKYENAEVGPSDGMEKLLRLAEEVPEARVWLLRRAGLPAPESRPCSREKECVVLPRRLAAAERASFRQSEKRDYRFTYSASAAANDARSETTSELTAVG